VIAKQTVVAIVCVVAALALVRVAAVAAFDIPQPEFEPLNWGPVLLGGVVAAHLGGLVLALLQRFSRRPVFVFRVISAIGVAVSLGGPLSLLNEDPATYAGTDGASVGTLLAMHLVAAAIIVGVLTSNRKVGGASSGAQAAEATP
jgi:uncharacterized membrane protein YczE